MRILVANDDGIHARGILTLAETLSEEHDVFVVAPDVEQSAMAHALTLHRPLRVKEVDLDFPVQQAFSVSGTPSDCVKIALSVLLKGENIDLVVSGINHGPNLGCDVLYSGTVSAALEGAINGLPSIAVSLVNGGEKMAEFSHGATFIRDFLPMAVAMGFPQKSVLNVNIPAISRSEFAGVKIAELGMRMYTDTYEKRIDPRGQTYYWLAGEIVDDSEEPESDVEAIRNNMVAITPIHFNLTHHKELDQLRKNMDNILDSLLSPAP